MIGWTQHCRSEQHRQEKLKRDEKALGTKEEKKIAGEKEEEKQKEAEEQEDLDEEIEKLERYVYNFELQTGSEEEGKKRTDYFLQQVKNQLTQM